MEKTKQLLSIQEVSKKLNISKPTLRYWENELEDIIIPIRSKGRQRRYTIDHISIISEIKKLRDVGISLEEIKDTIGNGCKKPRKSQINDNVERLAEKISDLIRKELYNYLNYNGS